VMQEKRNNPRKFILFFGKGWFLIPLLVFVSACNGDRSIGSNLPSNGLNSTAESLANQKVIQDSAVYCSTEKNLDGIWALTNYFNSILAEKTISKYRVQIPAWFGILLEIKQDSVSTFGSIHDMHAKAIACQADTLLIFETNWGEWSVVNHGEQLHLELIPNDDGLVNQTVYIYEKRPDLNNLIARKDQRLKLDLGITTYFNEKLVVGKYLNSKGDTIHFQKNGEVQGLRFYNEYWVDNYFGTSHPFQNLDMIVLRNHENHVLDYYHWDFKKDLLLLTNYLRDTVPYEDKWVATDDFVLGEKQFRLKVLK
jgi:hypothetical protein